MEIKIKEVELLINSFTSNIESAKDRLSDKSWASDKNSEYHLKIRLKAEIEIEIKLKLISFLENEFLKDK